MESTSLIITLIIAGVLAGGVNFFLNYVSLTFLNNSNKLGENKSLNKKKWFVFFGYLFVGILGAFLTPLVNVIIGLKGYYPDKYFLVSFGYGIVFGYLTSFLLVNVIKTILQKLLNLEFRLQLLEDSFQEVERREDISKNQTYIYRPKWIDVYEGYPKTNVGGDLPSPDVFISVFGPQYDTQKFQNACATRVSLGMLNANIKFEKPEFIVQVGEYKGKGFMTSAEKLKIEITNYFGDADIIIKKPVSLDAVQAKLGSKNGIYIILGGFNPGITGHSTLWIGKNKNVIGGNHYVNINSEIYFWELK